MICAIKVTMLRIVYLYIKSQFYAKKNCKIVFKATNQVDSMNKFE